MLSILLALLNGRLAERSLPLLGLPDLNLGLLLRGLRVSLLFLGLFFSVRRY